MLHRANPPLPSRRSSMVGANSFLKILLLTQRWCCISKTLVQHSLGVRCSRPPTTTVPIVLAHSPSELLLRACFSRSIAIVSRQWCSTALEPELRTLSTASALVLHFLFCSLALGPKLQSAPVLHFPSPLGSSTPTTNP